MRSRFVAFLVLAFLAAGCGATATASPSPSPVVTPAPTATPTATPSAAPSSPDPFAGKPYRLVIPVGWQTYDLSDPASKASLNAYVQANPAFASAIQAVEATPNVLVALNPLLGDAIVVLPIGSQGLSLQTVGLSIQAQLAEVPGLASAPAAQPTSLPGGDAMHWDLSLTVNKVGGGKVQALESVYLFVNAQWAVLLEFVTPGGGVSADETSVLQSFWFQP